MRCKRLVFAVATLFSALVGLSPLAAAQTGLERTDRNADGRITREEYRERMVEVFYIADRNVDGFLERNELLDTRPESFIAADENKDGKLALREFLNYRWRDFDRADKNRNGVLEDGEL